MKYLFLIFLLFNILGCNNKETKIQVKKQDSFIVKSENQIEENISHTSIKNDLVQLNDDLLQTLKDKDYLKFSSFIHPKKGVRFSMYAYVQPQKDKHFLQSDFEKYLPSKVKFTWGERDGSGEPLVLSIKDYFLQWVFKRDFTQSQFSLNEFQGHGNSLNNLEKIYPKLSFTENYIKGSEKYGHMDWNALRFVFEEFKGHYYLVAVINDEWTI